MSNSTDTNQASEDDQATRMEIHMAMLAKAENAKDAGHATVIKLGFAVSVAEELIRTEKLKLLAEVRERTAIFKVKAHDKKGQPHLYEAGRGVPTEVVDKLEAEL